ncbi:hypothetical protein [Paenibacillus agilis]|uniref:Uncharacterized protein n=1 Tax=Paenibacillus agilis TaxID=3020863 RepID=A0A559IEA2_9BACL|nr:hypothetical protein [Paenibacillus agilis]TVX85984.1 hypothetical protein FPZ44_23835 [Paenibacillus agilis]
MGFLLSWIISTAIVFFILFIVFNLDEKYLYGDVRDIAEEIWVLYIILTFVPIINIILCLVTTVVFIVLMICNFMDSHNMDGEKMLKKIFLVKED